jgi:hypothetical protein
MKTPLTYEEFIKLAEQNYTKGGDTYVECWDKKDFERYVEEFGAITKTKALKMFKLQKSLDDEYEAARRWYSGEDY